MRKTSSSPTIKKMMRMATQVHPSRLLVGQSLLLEPEELREVNLCKSIMTWFGSPIGFFPPSKLPQNKVVLQRYMHLREEHGNMVKQHKLVNILYTELLTEVWKPARIFTLGDKECKKIIDSLINKFRNFKKRPYKGAEDCPANTDEFT